MPPVRHDFTNTIIEILNKEFSGKGEIILRQSELLQYLNIKTKSANRGSKSRGGFANHYAVYVLVEDYINKGFDKKDNYSDYEGVQFTVLLHRQRQLPFGSKLQNHALNHRLNQEFKKYFPTLNYLPVIRDAKTNRYWINENLIKVTVNDRPINLANPIKKIIEAYIEAKKQAFTDFMAYSKKMIDIQEKSPEKAIEFIKSFLRPNIDARVFEIVSYAILKEYYSNQKIYWGWSPDEINPEYLILYKTGRTNANDGGIDFVMKPLGRFFQVTETIDAGKYFLDIDKVQRYPITFVVKSEQTVDQILDKVREQAFQRYRVNKIVARYIESVEEIINLPELINRFDQVLDRGTAKEVIEEIVLQSRIEFNVESEEDDILSLQ